MDKSSLDAITSDIKTNIMRNADLVYSEDGEYIPYLLDVVASLHNLLYKEVTGETYDYMHHWTNKIEYNGINDYLYDSLINKED